MLLLTTSSYAEEIMTHCPYELYATTISGPLGSSNLLALDPETGESTLIAPISAYGVNHVTSISFHTNGQIYAIGNDGNNVSSLLLVNCKTGTSYIIGPTGIPSTPGLGITDISFDKNNHLWAYLNKPGLGSDEVGLIDIETGNYIPLGNSGINDIGNGISHDLGGTLYHTGKLNLSTIDSSTGTSTPLPALRFFAPADTNPRINAMDIRPSSNVMYVGINDKAAGSASPPENYLGIVDLTTGMVSFLSDPAKMIFNLAGIAFNSKYKDEITIK